MFDYTISVTDSEKRRLEEFISALRTDCLAEMDPCSPLNTEAFESEFRTKLLTHHCFMGSPLYQESFDSAFISACIQAGFEVERAPDGQRFWDVRVAGKYTSLKSTKAKDLKEKKLHISKLTEAAWIQDCRSATTRRDYTFQLFDNYCNEVNAIVQLRYFAMSRYYELVEIPVKLFAQIFDVDKSYFSADGPTINIPVGKNPADFTLKLDRSDAKITIANINKALCCVHGSWQL